MTTTERVQAIQDRLEAATPGTWTWAENSTGYTSLTSDSGVVALCVGEDEEGTAFLDGPEEGSELIANGPADLAWALDRIAELEAERKRLLEVVDAAEPTASKVLAFSERTKVEGTLPLIHDTAAALLEVRRELVDE